MPKHRALGMAVRCARIVGLALIVPGDSEPAAHAVSKKWRPVLESLLLVPGVSQAWCNCSRFRLFCGPL
jgi:hypothetical protein